jgi:glycosyltransferase involved in cell wall biosynthesis
MKVFIIIPAYETASTVGEIVKKTSSYGQAVVVDDGSTDNTAEVAKQAGAIVLRHFVNRGYGAALITGMNYALQNGAEAVVNFDSDAQFESNEIPKLLTVLKPGRASVALGSRFLGKTLGMPTLRRLTLKLAIIFTWFISGIKLSDTHNGFRAFTAAALQQMNLKQDRMAFSSEVIDEIARLKIPYVEVPVTVHYTAYSRKSSQQGSWPVLKIVRDIFWSKLTR